MSRPQSEAGGDQPDPQQHPVPRRSPPGPTGAAATGPTAPAGPSGGPDRLAPLEAAEILRQRGGARLAPVRLLVQALQADDLQVARHLRVQPRGRRRLLFDDLPQRLRRRVRVKGRPAGQHLVQDRPQRVDVRGRPDGRSGPGPARGPCSSASPAGCRSGSAAASSSRRASPKSVILGVPSAVSRTFAGFRSRWMIPWSWAACTASASVASSAAARPAGSGAP